ncbi:hypothetical protein [Streptomyces sp. YS415]|nr:hypothetical protein [Streptomyces sp. YS415]MCL7429790.1 hypothetical protein [Streptomyces sp. YS415]
MIGLFSAALPEFLGSLCATLVVTIGAWAVRKACGRAATREDQTTPGEE